MLRQSFFERHVTGANRGAPLLKSPIVKTCSGATAPRRFPLARQRRKLQILTGNRRFRATSI